VRKKYWGYAADEALTVDEIDRRKVSWHPPAPGYPACPDHTAKAANCSACSMRTANADMELTESFAMTPAASVSGFYLAHPHAKYFAVTAKSGAISWKTGQRAAA
jgi:5-methyltetrahydrofolate--homocysteine methyltransferase